jgi:hypothetical protein
MRCFLEEELDRDIEDLRYLEQRLAPMRFTPFSYFCLLKREPLFAETLLLMPKHTANGPGSPR